MSVSNFLEHALHFLAKMLRLTRSPILKALRRCYFKKIEKITFFL